MSVAAVRLVIRTDRNCRSVLIGSKSPYISGPEEDGLECCSTMLVSVNESL